MTTERCATADQSAGRLLPRVNPEPEDLPARSSPCASSREGGAGSTAFGPEDRVSKRRTGCRLVHATGARCRFQSVQPSVPPLSSARLTSNTHPFGNAAVIDRITKPGKSSAEQAPVSPCVGSCQLDAQRQCTGCWRRIDEIIAWRTLSPTAQWRVLARVALRRARACMFSPNNSARS